MRYALTVGITLALAACASDNTWTRGPEADPNLSLEQQSSTGATFSNGNVDGDCTNQDFHICMRASR